MPFPAGTHSMHVLVADDDPGITQTLTDILMIFGHRVTVATSGDEALARVEEANPDCVLTDVRMPGMSGVDLCRVLNGRVPGLPVVVMTAYAYDGVVEKAIQQYATAAVAKPLDVDRLLEVLEQVCAEAGASLAGDDDPGRDRAGG
jgi:two-component system, NtrC family, response regulator HydG